MLSILTALESHKLPRPNPGLYSFPANDATGGVLAEAPHIRTGILLTTPHRGRWPKSEYRPDGVLGKMSTILCAQTKRDTLRRVRDRSCVHVDGIGECARVPPPSMCGDGNIVQAALIGGDAGAYS